MANRFDEIYHGRTLVFGHRGAKAYAPMNTLPAFELAAEQGADGVELDVHFSKDRALVVLHDFTVDGTTDGSGHVKELTLAQLKALDAGGWFGETFKNTRIPTLDEVFTAVGQKLYINVEIKVESGDTAGLEQAVAERIARFGMQRRVIVSSFNFPVLQRFRQTMPEVPIGFLYEEPMHDSQVFALLQNADFEALHPRHTLIDANSMQRAKDIGYRVNTWTVNEPARAVELRDLGVDLIISDNPDVILRALGR
jgi:glycerophosphoryl diester phosphodiesterase